MTSTHRWLADEAKDTRRLVPFPCLRQNPAGVRHERIPKLGADGMERTHRHGTAPRQPGAPQKVSILVVMERTHRQHWN